MARPNILFMTCHDLGQHLSCYGRQTVHSPALDRLAGEGVLFEKSFCTAPQCSPSRAALHTGRHAHSNGMLGLAHRPFNWRLHDDEKHAAQWLREAGYETALWGVQHLTRTADVARLGYDHYDADDPVAPAPIIAAQAAAFLRDPRRQDRPFYLEVGFFEPHRPYDYGGAPPDDSHGVEVPPYLDDTPQARREFAALQGAIRRLDEGVGRILAALEETGLDAHTWVIFAADHGVAMPRAKCTLYDPGIATALLMRWPTGGVGGGTRHGTLISYVDVLPTLLEGLGLPVPANLHGRSFWPLLQGQPYRPNDRIFAEKTYHTAYEPMRGIRTAAHKLIVNLEVDTKVNVPDDIREGAIYPTMLPRLVGQRPCLELYDLVNDPGETINLAGKPEYRAVERDLKAQLIDWMRATDDPILDGAVASPYHAAALAALDDP